MSAETLDRTQSWLIGAEVLGTDEIVVLITSLPQGGLGLVIHNDVTNTQFISGQSIPSGLALQPASSRVTPKVPKIGT